MNPLLDTLRNIGAMRLAAMVGVTVGLIVFFIFITTRLATPNMALLYGNLDPADSARIAGELEVIGVPFEVSADGSRVLVPSDQVARLRMSMAERGLPSGGSVGYEIFDREQTLGTSSLVQNINRVRALEGELARTISSLAPVRSARVHLVLPRRELFSRQQQEPTASIIIKMRGANRLDRNQVLAIQHLVATAVPGLKPTRISIVDDRGTLLARGGEDANAQFAGMTADEMRTMFESRLTRSLEQLLEPTVGIGNVRAEVRAEMDFDRIVTKEESWDPDGQVVRSSQTVSESSASSEAGPEAVTVESNLPDAGTSGGGGARSVTNRTEETTNFEISKTIRNQVREAGTVRRLSVAVLINGTETKGPDGKIQYQPRTPEEMQQIEKLVKSAIGYDEARGDTVEVVNLRFAGLPATFGEEVDTTIFGFSPGDLRRLVEVVVLAVVGILIILLVVRPLIAKIFEVTPQVIAQAGTTAEGAPAAIPPGAPGTPAITGPAAAAPAAPGAPGAPAEVGEEDLESMIDIGRVEGRVRASSLRKVGEIIEKHPEEAVAIIRNWMYQEQ